LIRLLSVRGWKFREGLIVDYVESAHRAAFSDVNPWEPR
jgi:hypothetical protein